MQRERLSRDEQIEQLLAFVRDFKERRQRRIVNEFPSLRTRLGTIAGLLATIDLNHLSTVPIRSLVELGKVIERAVECVTDYMMNSYPPEAQSATGVVRPPQWIRNQDNIRTWESRLDEVYADLYNITASIVTHQQARLARVAFSSRVEVDQSRSDLGSAESEMVWRYMPLTSLIRCEASSGIWFSSLDKLGVWSERGVIDTREGEVPPFLRDLKKEYDSALIGSDRAME